MEKNSRGKGNLYMSWQNFLSIVFRSFPALYFFTEGSYEDTEFSIQILKPCFEELFTQLISYDQNISSVTDSRERIYGTPETLSRSSTIDLASREEQEKSIPLFVDPLQVFYTGNDPICDLLLDSLGQGDTDLPLLMIINIHSGHMVICDKPDISEAIISDFVLDYRNGHSKILPIPLNNSDENKFVGGIPLDLIGQICEKTKKSAS